MNKSLKTIVLLLLSLAFSSACAQDIIMGQAALVNDVQEEARYFYDSGGPDGDFDTSLVETMTIKHAMNADFVLNVFFEDFVMGPGDTLWIYDGESAGSPLLGVYNLVSSPGDVYATGSALTFVFKSDNVIDPGLSFGWVARVSAYRQNQNEHKISNVDGGTIYTCNSKFYDSGGPNGKIAENNENYYVTFQSSAGSHLKCEFTQFKVNGVMKIYDGPYVPGFPEYNGRLIGQFCTSTLPTNGMPPVLFSSGEQLTFVYVGAANDKQKEGWAADITCVPELYVSDDASPCPKVTNVAGGAYANSNTGGGGISAEVSADTILFDCSTPVVMLSVDISATGKFSNDYTVKQIPESWRMFGYDQGTPFVVTASNADDVWLVQNLPFSFNFFGETYTKVYPGTNGLMSFETKQLNSSCAYSYDAPSASPPYSSTPYKYANCIYGVYEDIDPNNQHCPLNNAIRYGVVGQAPCRAFVFNYDNIGLYGQGGQYTDNYQNNYNTYQMVFYEGTNIIDIFIKKRRCCASTNGGLNNDNTPANAEKEGIVGLQNKTSSQILLAEGRGMTAWEVLDQAEGWRFTPITPYDELGDLKWYVAPASMTKDMLDDTYIKFDDPGAKLKRFTVSPSEDVKVWSRYEFTNSTGQSFTVWDSTLILVQIPQTTTSHTSGAGGSQTICPGEQCTLTVTPDSQEYPDVTPVHYSWNTAPADTNQSVNVAPEKTTTYYCKVTYSNGCTRNDSVKVEVTDLELPEITATDTTICLGEKTVLSATHSTATEYKWSNGATGQSITVSPQANTRYKVEVVMEGGCVVSDTLTINVNPLPKPAFIADPTEIYVENGVGTVTCTDNSPEQYSLVWNFGDVNSAVNEVQDVATAIHEYVRAGFYTITLTATDINGCVDSTKNKVSVTVPYFFFIPNAFSPNGDGDNERFAPKGEGVDPDYYSMQIYDRTGTIVFKTRNPYDYWDGRDKTGRFCPEGVYVYLIHLVNLNGEEKEYTGSVTLIR
ncbi:MAG: gliding motility-associated C-terminal domain-containing protein [Bacteroidales bacterium]|nr:gliding motility-associated C-terminal domain-containing protein [Bacteroidales bacterium]